LNKQCDKLIFNIEKMKKKNNIKIIKQFNFPDLKIVVEASDLKKATKRALKLSSN